MLYLQKTLGLQGLPLIAENGAVIQLAEQWQDIDGFPRIISGISHGEISRVLNTLREKNILNSRLSMMSTMQPSPNGRDCRSRGADAAA